MTTYLSAILTNGSSRKPDGTVTLYAAVTDGPKAQTGRSVHLSIPRDEIEGVIMTLARWASSPPHWEGYRSSFEIDADAQAFLRIMGRETDADKRLASQRDSRG
jgi:hypothetical protein